MAVPLLDVNAQNLPLEAELEAAFRRVLRHGRFILGPEVASFEKAAAEMLGAKHALGVSSGTDALLLAFMALGLEPGDEVLCPSFTFFATAGTIARTGATPVFVDVCPVCFNLDVVDARRKITEKTKAIVPVHLFGQSADMDAVNALAEAHGLRVIEDGAQAIGATYRGKACGTMSDFGCYSFFPSKNLGGFGDGGLLVTNDDELADRATILRVHGGRPKYYHHLVGANFRFDTLQAAMLEVKLPHYADYTLKRQANAAYFTERLRELPGVVEADPAHCRCADTQSEWIEEEGATLILPIAYDHNEHIWNQYTLRVIGEGRRDALRDSLLAREIGCEIYYPVTMDQQPCFQSLPDASRQGCEVAHRLADEVLSIPIYPELNDAQKDEVISAIAEFVEAGVTEATHG
ncbi:MAG: DegT/DnrJ/EryC1/StrS family aminotransferase [Verrucomicrobiae bacterium]|nr:DegT/DnrJ/EryC1/StrS family aminotransferase [Verrucomicrobiae bacterium]